MAKYPYYLLVSGDLPHAEGRQKESGRVAFPESFLIHFKEFKCTDAITFEVVLFENFSYLI